MFGFLKRTKSSVRKPEVLSFQLGTINAFYHTHYRSLGYDSKYCPLNEVLMARNTFREISPEGLLNFLQGAREAMRANNYDRPCCQNQAQSSEITYRYTQTSPSLAGSH